MAEKTTLHSARGRVSGAHNDRTFKSVGYDADHIDPELSNHNMFYTREHKLLLQAVFTAGKHSYARDLSESYAKLFSGALERQNDRNVKARHPERCRTISDWEHSAQKGIRETIFQIGKHETDPTIQEKVANAVYKLQREYEERFPDNYHCLGWAFHADEVEYGSMHVHLDDIFAFKGADGLLEPSQDKALEQMGYELPDPSKPKGKHNNRLMSFTAEQRSRFIEICREAGLEIDDVPNSKQKHKETKHDLEKRCAELEAKCQRLEDQQKAIWGNTLKASELEAKEGELNSKEKRIQATGKAVLELAAELGDRVRDDAESYIDDEIESYDIEDSPYSW